MEFSDLINDLKNNFIQNQTTLQKLTKQNPNGAYFQIIEIAKFVGKRHNVDLQLHFPDSRKILEIETYGDQNIGIVTDKFRKKFKISKDLIKIEAKKKIPDVTVLDAYMYEDKEGLRLQVKSGRIEILPGSVHIWCMIDQNIENFMNWLLEFVLR
ncbi:MAG: hypothetical protein MRJ93_04270 [Nitrososphaeraceae archaeon]|nr:hypothetical protein [Nitrososphaeraceae archaeon]